MRTFNFNPGRGAKKEGHLSERGRGAGGSTRFRDAFEESSRRGSRKREEGGRSRILRILRLQPPHPHRRRLQRLPSKPQSPRNSCTLANTTSQTARAIRGRDGRSIRRSIWTLFRLRLYNDSSKQSSPFTALLHRRRRRRHRGGRGRSPSEAPLGRLHRDSALRGVARHIASHELCQGESRGTEATIAQER